MNEAKPRPEVRKAKAKALKAWIRTPLFKILVTVFLFGLIATSATGLYFYVQFSRMIDRKLNGEVFKNTAKIYAAPYRIYPGQRLTPDNVVARLQRAGFETADKGANADGVYTLANNRLTIKPNSGDLLRLDFGKNSIARIVKPGASEDLSEALLPPELVTNLFDQSREKRRIVEFKEIPKVLRDALIASEDRRFYDHYGLDPIRLVGAVIDSVTRVKRIQGTSTLTQQVARNFFLGAGAVQDRSPKRKLSEMFLAVLLEQRLTKEQILTLYANEIYLGDRGSFSLHGFGEGSAAYYGKDIGQITLPEAATLIGIIPSPNAFNPGRHPDRAKARRDIVLTSMHSTHAITDAEFEAAKASPVNVAPLKMDASEAPYLVDFIRDELQKDYSDDVLLNGNLRVYTSIDPDLQKAAVEAVEKGLKTALDEIARRNKGKKNPDKGPDPQAALIALDPHTGEIKAMVGGTNYAFSQYNRITQAFRQPGSIFKPFVYAAAFEMAFGDQILSPKEEPAPATPTEGDAKPAATPETPTPDIEKHPLDLETLVTPVTQIIDEPTTFIYEGDRIYEPNNYKQQYRGIVTVREALQHSLNVPTIKVAEKIGYDRVAKLALRAGLNAKIKGYPSVALGAFEVTPIEMAGAYTIFSNEGKRLEPHALMRISTPDGKTAKTYKYEPQEIIRPELAYLMTHLLEGVIDNGTGVGVRTRGFRLPAAGKTGTSRDGWFAGYTKDLLAIAWVGYDDNRDLNVEGAHSALPIWTEFMIKADQLYPVRDEDRMYFEPPSGVESVRLDRETLGLATPQCPDTFSETFLAGTAPTTYCPIHGYHPFESVGNTVRGFGRWFGDLFKGRRSGLSRR